MKTPEGSKVQVQASPEY